jgi:serine protease inhibitor
MVIFAMLLMISGCDKELTEAEESKILKKLSPQDLELINATNNLSLNIIQAEYEQNKERNFFFSPVSVGMALGMIYNGVGEKEKYQIQQMTGLETLVENEINKSYNEFITFLQLNYDQTNVFCANSLWFSYGLDINEDYRTKIMAYYDAEISEINFGKKTALQYINSWGSLKSRGQLETVTKITPTNDYHIYLVNAFGMNTSWKNGRYFSKPLSFTGSTGETVDVTSINLDQADVAASFNVDFDYIEIPLGGQNFMFSIVQPAVGISLDNLINNYDLHELSAHSSTQEMQANVSMPEISFARENNLKSTLGHLGLEEIFTPALDLSPSFVSKSQGISEINQVAMFNIEGQLAANDDLVFSNPNLKSIKVNKPFLYFVKDQHTKSVIFAGYYTNPEK